MRLTLQYIQNTAPFDQSLIRHRLNFFGRGLYELTNGRFYLRQDYHIVDDLGFNAPIEIYRMNNELYAYLINSNMQTKVQEVNMIHSNTIGEFTGFESGRRFRLENGQVWEQIGGVFSNCQPGGIVLIKDNNLMQVGNWDFEINVRQIIQ